MKINHYASSQEKKKRVEVEMVVILSWETRAAFVTEKGVPADWLPPVRCRRCQHGCVTVPHRQWEIINRSSDVGADIAVEGGADGSGGQQEAGDKRQETGGNAVSTVGSASQADVTTGITHSS